MALLRNQSWTKRKLLLHLLLDIPLDSISGMSIFVLRLLYRDKISTVGRHRMLPPIFVTCSGLAALCGKLAAYDEPPI